MTLLPDVSILIVNWNGRDMLRNLLASLESAEPSLVMETIVVDNASTDDSLDQVPERFPAVKLIRNADNRGFAKGNNQAAAVATGRYLFFLNNDTIVHPGAIGKLVAFLDANPKYSAVGPKLIGGDGKPQRTGRNLPTFRAILHQRLMLLPGWTGIFRGAYQDYRKGGFEPEKSGDVPQLAAAALLVRRDWFEQAGRWDEGYAFGVEDVDLCVRLNRLGPIHYLADATIDHLGRIASQANYGFTYTGYECGYARYFGKHHRNRNAGRWYKVLTTIDMPLRLTVLGLQTIGYNLIFRRESAKRSWRRLSAAGAFFFRRMPLFWKS